MYLIVSATKNYKPTYKFKLDNSHMLGCLNAVGHELCLTRHIIMILLSNNLISKDDTIVTRNKDRFFLYSNIFKNVIAYDDMPANIEDSQIIDIGQANLYFNINKELTEHVKNIPGWAQMPYETKEQILLQITHDIEGKCAPPMQTMEITDVEKRFPIMTHIRNKQVNYRNELFNSLITNIAYQGCSSLIKKDFVIVHHRVVSYSPESKDTHTIVSAIKVIDPEVQIFIFCIKKLEGFSSDVIFIDDLSLHASLMHHEKCKAVFSEFSGGGIMAQYYHNKKIFYLETAYTIYQDFDIHNVIIETNQPNNLYDKFDMVLFSNPSIYIFKDIDLFLNKFKQYYFDKGTKIIRV